MIKDYSLIKFRKIDVLNSLTINNIYLSNYDFLFYQRYASEINNNSYDLVMNINSKHPGNYTNYIRKIKNY